MMKVAGWVTGHFGKYINAHSKSRSVPPYWDRWCETLGDGSDTVGDATTLNRANVDGVITDPLPGILSVWSAERCADFVRARASSPWFAQYCPTIPHFPYTLSASSEHLYDGAKRHAPSVNEADMSDKPKWMRGLPRIKAQAEFEGKKEELADLDRFRPVPGAEQGKGRKADADRASHRHR